MLPNGFAVEQVSHTTASATPHWLQKRLPSGVEARQRGHVISSQSLQRLYRRDGSQPRNVAASFVDAPGTVCGVSGSVDGRVVLNYETNCGAGRCPTARS